MEWISVKDRLPEGDNPILIYTKNAYSDIGGFGKISISSHGKSLLEGKFVSFEMLSMPQLQSMSNRENEILNNITHWMPLPEPPKEEENETF